MNKIFIAASRQQYRFHVSGKTAYTEDLWVLPLTALNTLAKNLDAEIKAAGEVDFLGNGGGAPESLLNRFEIVKYVIQTRLVEAKAKDQARKDLLHNAQIDVAIAEAEGKSLKKLSVEDLQKLKR